MTPRKTVKCSCGAVEIQARLDFVWTMETGITHWRPPALCTRSRRASPSPLSPAPDRNHEGGK